MFYVISRELILSLGMLKLHFEHNASSGACLEGVQPSNRLPLIIIHSGRSSVIHKVNLNSSLPKSQVQKSSNLWSYSGERIGIIIIKKKKISECDDDQHVIIILYSKITYS